MDFKTPAPHDGWMHSFLEIKRLAKLQLPIVLSQLGWAIVHCVKTSTCDPRWIKTSATTRAGVLAAATTATVRQLMPLQLVVNAGDICRMSSNDQTQKARLILATPVELVVLQYLLCSGYL